MADKKNKQSFWEQIREFAVLLLVVFLIRTFGFGLYQVPTPSMETTLLMGERFFADKLSYNFRAPQRGEIIAFNEPRYKYSSNMVKNLFERYVWGPSNWTKRVIGVPGDTVEGKVEDNKPVIYLNGVKLDEPYLNAYPILLTYTQDPKELAVSLNQELARASSLQINPGFAIEQSLDQHTTRKSYDPDKPYHEQPFYRIDPARIVYEKDGSLLQVIYDRIVLNKEGTKELAWPGTLIRPCEPGKQFTNPDRHWDGSDVFRITLGADEYWGMGDNRLGSGDSRAFGPIKSQLIHGRILFRIWSIDSDESWALLDLIKHPIDFFKRVRWNRFFQWV